MPEVTLSDLQQKQCKPCEGGVPPLTPEVVSRLIQQLPCWEVAGSEIARTFRFRNYYETVAFVNAIAWFTHQENHHPDLEVGFKTCRVRYSTHAIGGLSENDFICAAKVQALLNDEV